MRNRLETNTRSGQSSKMPLEGEQRLRNTFDTRVERQQARQKRSLYVSRNSRPIRSGSRPLDTFFRPTRVSLGVETHWAECTRRLPSRESMRRRMLLNVESVHFSSRLACAHALHSTLSLFHHPYDRIQPPWITRGAPFQSTARVLSRGSPLLGQASTIFFAFATPDHPFSAPRIDRSSPLEALQTVV